MAVKFELDLLESTCVSFLLSIGSIFFVLLAPCYGKSREKSVRRKVGFLAMCIDNFWLMTLSS